MQYKTVGTCCQFMQVAIENNKIVDVEFFGGCNGNLQGIKKLVIGMDIDEVISRLEGIQCGPKPTSCPDQLAKCLIEYKSKVDSVQ
ncbi:MAG: TIGR03905 family TSCPD domain-containing protein [Cyanobacteria bacterium SIG26]|nr:TIGR03905 family TSCPD domain-containing protein [Cyanobacteria bacterium SIG26]